MIDNFALLLSHGLILLAMWRLLRRPDLDDDEAPAPEQRQESETNILKRWKGRAGA